VLFGRGQLLYELPWYIFVGAPGSGKTTALLNAGLTFPLAEKLGNAARATIAARFSLEATLERLGHIYRQFGIEARVPLQTR